MIDEHKFILLCTGVEPDDSACNEIIKLSENPELDWDLVFDFALQQRVWLLVYQNINSLISHNVPERITKKFKESYIVNVARNIRLTNSLLNIVDLFSAKDIEILPFKGPVLAKTVYNSIYLRFFVDLDVLIRKENIIAAWRILQNAGFQAVLNLSDTQKIKYSETEDHMAFSKGSICIELHWEITGIYLSKPLQFEHLANNLNKFYIDDKEVLNLSSEVLLLYLCIHGSKDVWKNLEQICSISELIRKNKILNWNLINQLSKEWECRYMLLLGLSLSQNIFNVPLPTFILDNINNNKKILTLTEQIKTQMFNISISRKQKKMPNRFNPHHIRIRDSLKAKLIYILRLVFSPTEKEWRYFPITARLSFTHYLLRPLRLLIAIFWKRYA